MLGENTPDARRCWGFLLPLLRKNSMIKRGSTGGLVGSCYLRFFLSMRGQKEKEGCACQRALPVAF